MTSINNLLWPIYLLITLGLSIFMIQYFIRNIKKYTIPFSVGIILFSTSPFFIGIEKICYLLDIKWYFDYFKYMPLFGLSGILVLIIFIFVKAKENPELGREVKRTLILPSLLFLIPLLLLGLIFLSLE